MTATHLRLAETTAERNEWMRRAARLAEALRGVERGHIQQGSAVCPDCGYTENEGHYADCKVGSVLAEYDAASGKTGGGSGVESGGTKEAT